MSNKAVEERVTELERLVVALTSQSKTGNRRGKNWRRTLGAFTGDALMKQVFVQGRKIRKAEANGQSGSNGHPRRADS